MSKGLKLGGALALSGVLAFSGALPEGANGANSTANSKLAATAAQGSLVSAADIAQRAAVAVIRKSLNDETYNHPDRLHVNIKGSAVHIRDGYILTALHVVRPAQDDGGAAPDEITIITRGMQELPARFVGKSEYLDIALYRIDSAALKVPLADVAIAGRDLVPGEDIFTVGYPYSMGRTLVFGHAGEPDSYQGTISSRVIQTDIFSCSGNSGGGIFNSNGELSGIVHGIVQTEPQCSRITYSVPGRMLGLTVDSMIRGRGIRFASLGVGLEESVKLNDVWRVVVTGVNGAAQAAGIRKRDIIISIDDAPVFSANQLRAYVVEKTVPGQRSDVKVLRDGVEKTFSVTMGAMAP